MDTINLANRINEVIGQSVVPFDCIFSMLLDIYYKFGGTEKEFSTIYELVEAISELTCGGVDISLLDEIWKELTDDAPSDDARELTDNIIILIRQLFDVATIDEIKKIFDKWQN